MFSSDALAGNILAVFNLELALGARWASLLRSSHVCFLGEVEHAFYFTTDGVRFFGGDARRDVISTAVKPLVAVVLPAAVRSSRCCCTFWCTTYDMVRGVYDGLF